MDELISRADRHAIVDEYWKSRLEKVDMADSMAFYHAHALQRMWLEDKLDIDNPERAELLRSMPRSI